MPTIEANGITIYYERQGSGHRLLFFNGSGTSLATTGFLLKPFWERFDTLAHDQRGMGRTDVPAGPFTMADYAADAAGLLDQVGWDRCRVVGVSFGGMVAQEFAVTYPERVRTPGAAVHLGRRGRGAVLPPARAVRAAGRRADRGGRAHPRLPLRRRLAGRPSGRSGHRRDDGGP